jgi:hypothetical protein
VCAGTIDAGSGGSNGCAGASAGAGHAVTGLGDAPLRTLAGCATTFTACGGVHPVERRSLDTCAAGISGGDETGGAVIIVVAATGVAVTGVTATGIGRVDRFARPGDGEDDDDDDDEDAVDAPRLAGSGGFAPRIGV